MTDNWNRWPRQQSAVREALETVFQSGDWGRYDGTQCERLRGELGEYFGGQDVYLCASGTLGIELALRGLDVQPRDEVILAGYDFPGNFRAIEAIGALPVLVDLKPGHWTLDPNQLSAAVTKQTRAVIVSHLHGDLAPMPAVVDWARAHGVRVVEDACQMPGGQLAGRPVGNWGDVSVLSFGGSKLLTSGRGGAVLSSDPLALQRVRVYAERGNDAFALSELQAAVLRPQLALLDEDSAVRERHARRLCEHLQPVHLLAGLPQTGDRSLPAYYKLAFWYRGDQADRATFVQALRAAGVPVGVGFRGFTLRSPRRCRKVGDLSASRIAAMATVLLHHPVLLQDPDVLKQLARKITTVAEQFDTRTDS